MSRRIALDPLTPIWVALALVVGLLAASQPPAVTLIAFALAAFAVASLITPLSALAVVLTLAPMRTLLQTEAPSVPDIGLLTLAALIGFWLIRAAAQRRSLPRLIWSPVLIPVIGFLAATGISAFSALSVSAWLSEWLKWVSVLLLIVVCLDLGAREWLVFLLVASGLPNALIGVYEFFGGSGTLVLLIDNRYFRAFGTFGQPNPFGGFMGLLAPIALTAALGYGVRARRSRRSSALLLAIFYALAAALLSAALFLSWSRGAWLGFAASMLAILLALPRKWWYGVAPAALIVAVIAALWVSGRLPASVISRIQSVTDEVAAFSDVRGVEITPENYANVERLAHWQAAIGMIEAHPIFGVGFGNYEVAYSSYSLLNWPLALGHAHNYYLNVFAEAGIIGLIGYGALWITVTALTWRARRHPDPLARLIIIGLFGAWTYLAVHSLTDNLYVNNLFLHIGVMLGLLAVLQRSQWVRIE